MKKSLIYGDTLNLTRFQLYGEHKGRSMGRFQMGQYVAGVYWAFTTMTTVGYGDILPQNDIERAFAILIMFTGMIALPVLLTIFELELSATL